MSEDFRPETGPAPAFDPPSQNALVSDIVGAIKQANKELADEQRAEQRKEHERSNSRQRLALAVVAAVILTLFGVALVSYFATENGETEQNEWDIDTLERDDDELQTEIDEINGILIENGLRPDPAAVCDAQGMLYDPVYDDCYGNKPDPSITIVPSPVIAQTLDDFCEPFINVRKGPIPVICGIYIVDPEVIVTDVVPGPNAEPPSTEAPAAAAYDNQADCEAAGSTWIQDPSWDDGVCVNIDVQTAAADDVTACLNGGGSWYDPDISDTAPGSCSFD